MELLERFNKEFVIEIEGGSLDPETRTVWGFTIKMNANGYKVTIPKCTAMYAGSGFVLSKRDTARFGPILANPKVVASDTYTHIFEEAFQNKRATFVIAVISLSGTFVGGSTPTPHGKAKNDIFSLIEKRVSDLLVERFIKAK